MRADDGRTERHKIVIIGSGFGGIGMGIGLRKAGFDDFVILEKATDLGGTWRDNRYPGCACDVPSPLYSFSYELNPDWSRLFAPQREIWEYLRGCAATYGVAGHIRYGCQVESMEWDDADRRWTVRTADGTRYRAHAVISAAGALHIPRYPDIPGIDSFAGDSFHSSGWDPAVDMAGKRVAVIGTGASAIQLVPVVAREAAHLTVFQRTPPWLHPRPDVAIPPRTRAALRTVPGAARALRNVVYWGLETRALGFAVDPRLMAPLTAMARTHLERQVPDPGLRARLTPDYTIGCKRILVSSDYYPALQRPDVDLVTDAIGAIGSSGVVTADGTLHEADVLVFATGFRVVDAATELNVTGRGGVKLKDTWAAGVEAYRGITVPGFPNFFLLLGPNTGLGHTSVVFMIETQVQHVLSCLRILSREKAAVIEAREPATRLYNDALQRRLRRAVWSAGGCRSWYLDDAGINRAIWPGFSFEYWARTRRARRRDYEVRVLPEGSAHHSKIGVMDPAPQGADRGRDAARGIGVVAGLIGRTLGPAGRPALIKDQAGSDIEAPDAETIVACFTPADPGDGLGASYVRDLVRDQHAEAPDGAATAVVLASAMVRQAVAAMDGKADPTRLVRGIMAARDRVLDELGRRATDLRSKEEITAVMAAAIFDRALADVLAEAFDKVGKDGIIVVEPAGEPCRELALSQGMSVDGGYVSPVFVTDAQRGEAVLRDPYLLLVDAEVSAAEDLRPAIDAATAAGRPLVVLAVGVTGAAFEILEANRASRDCATLAAWVAGDPFARALVLGDLAAVTGASVVGGSVVGGSPPPASDGPGSLGSAGKVVATCDRTVIVGGAADEAVLRDRIRQIRAEIELAESYGERQELFMRMAKLAGGAATVRIGGATSAETARLVARAERGLRIARLAMDYPILPGGGAALADVQEATAKFPRSVPGGRSGDEATGARIMLDSLTAPMRQLAGNAGVPMAAIDKALKSRKDGTGIDPGTGKTVPMRPQALDVLPVLQAAVTNAAALAVRVLTG